MIKSLIKMLQHHRGPCYALRHMQKLIYNCPMTRRWFRDSIGTIYAWDHQDRYFYMFVEWVRDPYWIPVSPLYWKLFQAAK